MTCKKLKLFQFLNLVLLFKITHAQDLNDKTIKINKISKIIAIQKSKYYSKTTETYYDTNGQEIKSICIDKGADIDSSISFNTYKGSLLKKQVSRTFYQRKLLESAMTNYNYQTDDYGIKVSKIISENYGRVNRRFKETYRLKSSFYIDTTLMYSNDTIVTTNSQLFSHLEAGGAKVLHLARIELREKDENLNLIKYTECKVYDNQKFIDSSACIYRKFYKVRDTSVIEDVFWSLGGNKYRNSNCTKSVQVSGMEEYSESSYGDTTRVFYKKNKQQLITESQTEITPTHGDKRIYITKYKYFFWPVKSKL